MFGRSRGNGRVSHLPDFHWQVNDIDLVGIAQHERWKKLNDKKDDADRPFLLDARSTQEYKQLRLGVGETLIPLGALRNRLQELPQDKEHEIICFCKISLRGYEAALILMAAGWKNVKVMEGGIMAWPFAREK